MSVHVSETCNESNGLWLPLIEYSVKSGVSLSTIRRKIKSNSIQYRLEKGKYLILFNEGSTPTVTVAKAPAPAPSLARKLDEVVSMAPPAPRVETVYTPSKEGKNSPLVDDSVRMVSDAFEHALKEKDERIRLLERHNHELEERLKELQLLVRVLEEKYEVRY